jgi:hypothetical protein
VTASRDTRRAVNLKPRRQGAPTPAFVTKATQPVTAVASIRRAGMITKHVRVNFSRTDIPWENSMPVAKHLSYTASRGRLSLSHRIDRSAPFGQRVHQDGVSRRPSRRRLPLRSRLVDGLRSIYVGLAALAAHASAAPTLVFAIASWIAAETLAGCAAYAKAMYPALAMDDLPQPVDARSSEPKAPKHRKPDLRVVIQDPDERTLRGVPLSAVEIESIVPSGTRPE